MVLVVLSEFSFITKRKLDIIVDFRGYTGTKFHSKTLRSLIFDTGDTLPFFIIRTANGLFFYLLKPGIQPLCTAAITDPAILFNIAALALADHIRDCSLDSAAAIRNKRNHLFAAHIISFNKAADLRRNRSPPVRRTEKDNIVLCNIGNSSRQLRTIAGFNFLFGLFSHRMI